MSPDRKEPSENPIHDLFPVSERAARTGYDEILAVLLDPMLSEESQDLEIKLFAATNPDLHSYIGNNGETYGRVTGMDFYLFGGLYVHRALREEAKNRGGTLPIIPLGVIEGFHADMYVLPDHADRRSQRMRVLFQEEQDLLGPFQPLVFAIPQAARTALTFGVVDLYFIFRTNFEISKLNSSFNRF